MDPRMSVASLVNDSNAGAHEGPSQHPRSQTLHHGRHASTLSSSFSTSPTSTQEHYLEAKQNMAAIDAQDENVLIAVRALEDMRGGGGRGGYTSHPSGTIYPGDAHSRMDRHSWRDGGISGTSGQPTPSLSIASSSRATSPSIRTRSFDDDDESRSQAPPPTELDEMQLDVEGEDGFVSRVSTIPLVNTALKAYEQSKASSRVINYGAGLVESSVKTISKPVMNRLPVNQLDEFACRQLDRLGKYGGRRSPSGSPMDIDRRTKRTRSSSRSRERSPSPSTSALPREEGSRSSAAEGSSNDAEASQRQVSVTTRSGWQTMLLEAGGLGVAVSEESMKRLKYVLQWLQYATGHIDQQILILRRFLTSLDNAVANNPDTIVSMAAMSSLTAVKKDVVTTVRQVVDVVSKYAGGALPESARTTVRGVILLLPERWARAMQEQEAERSTTASATTSPTVATSSLPHANGDIPENSTGHDSGSRPTAGAALLATRKVLTLANESLDMMRSVTGVCKESLDRAEIWVERLRLVGIQRQREQQQVAAVVSSNHFEADSPSSNEASSSQSRRRGFSNAGNDAASASSVGWHTAPNSPGFDLQSLSITSIYETPLGSRRASTTSFDEEDDDRRDGGGDDTETEGDRTSMRSGFSGNGRLRRRQRRRLNSPSPNPDSSSATPGRSMDIDSSS